MGSRTGEGEAGQRCDFRRCPLDQSDPLWGGGGGGLCSLLRLEICLYSGEGARLLRSYPGQSMALLLPGKRLREVCQFPEAARTTHRKIGS